MKSIYLNILALVIACVGVGYTFLTTQKEEVAYVDMQYLFNEFDATKEYKVELDGLARRHKSILDSVRLNVIGLTNARGEYDSLVIQHRNYFLRIQEEFSNAKMDKANELDSKIWSQINQYVVDYGKTKSYKIILGAGTDGNVMYAQEQVNVSKEVLEFMNKKYSGE